MSLVAFYTDPLFVAHETGTGHVERPARLGAVAEAASRRDVSPHLLPVPCPPASLDDVAVVHERGYLEAVAHLCEEGGGHLDLDTVVSEVSFEAALLATGAGLDAVARIDAGEAATAFVAGRPPGHHARPAEAMGFCIVNHVAVVAFHLARRGQRVAVVDWDVHHGNGTQEMFWRDPRVLYLSIHQFPFYPGTGRHDDVGADAGLGATVNVPLRTGSGPPDYQHAWERVVLPALEAFVPEWILVSCGFDAHRDDLLGSMRLDAAAYGAMATDLRATALPLIAFLEGGYDLDAITESSAAVVLALAGARQGAWSAGQASPSTMAIVDAVLDAHGGGFSGGSLSGHR